MPLQVGPESTFEPTLTTTAARLHLFKNVQIVK